MTPEVAAGLFGEGLFLVVVMVAVIVVPSLLVGLVISMFQAATQINEQTLSFLPRLMATLATVMITGPWLIGRVMDFFNRIFMDIPHLIG